MGGIEQYVTVIITLTECSLVEAKVFASYTMVFTIPAITSRS